MSYWGAHVNEDHTEVHVVPIDRDLRVLGGHFCSALCFCEPLPDRQFPNLFVHHDPERGGTRNGQIHA